jgi:polyphosphate kinase
VITQPRAPQPAIPVASLDDPAFYISRELSWLEFNDRVLEEALDERNPLMERLKFVAIYGTNLDEFFMIRVAAPRRVARRPNTSRPSRSGYAPRCRCKCACSTNSFYRRSNARVSS